MSAEKISVIYLNLYVHYQTPIEMEYATFAFDGWRLVWRFLSL